MKNSLYLQIIILFTLLQISVSLKAQTFTGRDAEAIVTGAREVRIDANRKSVSFIHLNESARVSESVQLKWLQLAVKSDINTSFSLVKKEDDNIGYVHFRYSQNYKGLKVEYGRYYVHVKNGFIQSANGEYYQGISVNTQPSISKEAALEIAMRHINGNLYRDDRSTMLKTSEILIFPFKNKFYCAYKFDVYSTAPLKRAYVYINALTGEVITDVNRIHTADSHGTAVTAYNGTVTMTTDSISSNSYRLRGQKGFSGFRTMNLQNGSSYGSAVDFTDNDNLWNVTNIDQYATDAHFGAEATYDWYFTRFGRNSYDNAGIQMNSYVHYSSGYVNAFWDGDQFTYGDGDGIDFTPLTSLDIVGHEITHAVTEYTAGLVYSGESGALNEGYSDCMGVTVDFYKNPLTANFLEGDQINVNGIPFRNMSNPNQYNNPDTYMGTFWDAFGEVHCNSGVMNYWYYLMCSGGSGTNDNGDNFTVNSITMTKASEVAYRALTVYLTPSSTYNDMRDAAIQSAIDLYGNCSNEVIQVTNAWYAVGVGGLFSNAVVAGFTASQNFLCVIPSTVTFANNSINGLTYSWTFGDGGTSTAANPSHIYTLAGSYTVTLIASGSASCSSADTLQMVNYITVTNGGGPVTPTCQPSTVTYCCGYGITNVHFNTINNTSLPASEGYKDFTCANSTTITAGDPVVLTVITGTANPENLKVWIDYNNDGAFNTTNEQVFVSNSQMITHSGIVHTSIGAVLNTPLRLRLTDENSSTTISGGCYNSIYGQSEDYTVTFVPATQKPVADFTADYQTINVGGTVNFSDLSIHGASAWQWTFTGGTPTSSVIQNPSVMYNVLGTYAVKLKVTNVFGADSITKTTYINVVNSINMCEGTAVTNAINGQFYDSGGLGDSYEDNESCSLLINPGCAISITMTFSQFNSESCCDHLYIYDGVNTSGPLLADLFGSPVLPTITAASGKMFIVWYSDFSVFTSGWSASWTSVVGSGLPPVAGFNESTINPPLAVDVQFTDATTNMPTSWSWDFGDGNGSLLQNPLHAYSTSGTYTVILIASNCISSDTISKVVTVQSAPIITANPTTINQTLNCNDSIVIPITISNTGGGDGVYIVDGSSGGIDTVHVLAFMEGVDIFSEYPHTISAINTYFNRYTITQFNSIQPAALQTALTGMNVLLFPEQETGSSSFYSSIANVVQNFVTNGGRVIILGSIGGFENRMYDMGLFTGSYQLNVASQLILVPDTTDELTINCPSSFYGPNAMICHDITNIDKVELGSVNSYDLLTYRNIGSGKVIYLGFDYYSTNVGASVLISNAISSTRVSSPWLQLNQVTDTLLPGGSQVIYVTLTSAELNAGLYQQQIVLHSNDPANPLINIDINMTVLGPAEITMSDSCINFGPIIQFTSKTDSIEIFNNGCDTLHLTSISSNNSAFVSSVSSLNIPPGSSENLIVTFHPLTLGSFTGILTILNNGNDTTICLNGISGTVGVNEINGTSSFRVYPNPFTDQVNISYTLTTSKVITLQIFDLLGNLVQSIASDQQQTAGAYTYTLKDFTESVYFVRLIVDDRSTVFKLVRLN